MSANQRFFTFILRFCLELTSSHVLTGTEATLFRYFFLLNLLMLILSLIEGKSLEILAMLKSCQHLGYTEELQDFFCLSADLEE
jgi:hypothetical protein